MGHFRLRNKDGGHTILHENFAAPSSVEPALLPIKVLRNREYRAFCSCNLDLDSMTFIYEMGLCLQKSYPQTKSKLSASRLAKVTDRQRDRQTDAT